MKAVFSRLSKIRFPVALPFSLVLIFVLLAALIIAQADSASAGGPGSCTLPFDYYSSNNDPEFNKALGFALKYFKTAIQFLIHLWCVAVKALGISCGA